MNSIKSLLAILAAVLLVWGCAGGPQRTAFNSIGAVDATATAAMNELLREAVAHQIPTNNIPEASLRYNQLHAALLLASISAENGTNALAPAALVTEGKQLGVFILSLEHK